jgi:hypothetical protein
MIQAVGLEDLQPVGHGAGVYREVHRDRCSQQLCLEPGTPSLFRHVSLCYFVAAVTL